MPELPSSTPHRPWSLPCTQSSSYQRRFRFADCRDCEKDDSLFLGQRLLKRDSGLFPLIGEVISPDSANTAVINLINHCKHPFGYFLACCTCLTMLIWKLFYAYCPNWLGLTEQQNITIFRGEGWLCKAFDRLYAHLYGGRCCFIGEKTVKLCLQTKSAWKRAYFMLK